MTTLKTGKGNEFHWTTIGFPEFVDAGNTHLDKELII